MTTKPTTTETTLDEPILDDSFPVFWDYAYVCDGAVRLSPIRGTVWDLKRELSVSEVRRCDLLGRGLLR